MIGPELCTEGTRCHRPGSRYEQSVTVRAGRLLSGEVGGNVFRARDVNAHPPTPMHADFFWDFTDW